MRYRRKLTSKSCQKNEKEPKVHNHPLTPNGKTFALLDTNALIPPRLSDVLFDCAGQGMFLPRWTCKIEEEFLENWGDVVFNVQPSIRKKRKAEKRPPPREYLAGAQKRMAAFRAATGGFEWEILGYDDQDVIARVPESVDDGDVHLVAACLIQLDSLSEEPGEHRLFLLSNNLKHLSIQTLKMLGIEVLMPGKFIDLLCMMDPVRLEKSFNITISDLKNYSKVQLLSALSVHGATETVKNFSNKWALNISGGSLSL
jgi:hypothetical protein